MNDESSGVAPEPEEPTFGIDTLCALSGVARRTARFYIQKGLLDPPEGERRGAYYTRHHLEQLLLIRTWSDAGLSLERIRRMLRGEIGPLPQAPTSGTVEVWSRVTLCPGIEVHLDPTRLGLDAEQVRALIGRLMAAIEAPSEGAPE